MYFFPLLVPTPKARANSEKHWGYVHEKYAAVYQVIDQDTFTKNEMGQPFKNLNQFIH